MDELVVIESFAGFISDDIVVLASQPVRPNFTFFNEGQANMHAHKSNF